MNTTIKVVLCVLAVLSLLIVGCKTMERTAPVSADVSSAGELAESEVALELNELDSLEELESELNDLDWDMAEDAVR
ncbi:MAG: hypothetical protein Q7K45_05220 [Nanoarchaeota archaeon]|nr:hypothetical protein [Nanoarchaeota archaeon]